MKKKILALLTAIFFLLSFALFTYSLSVTLDLNPDSGDEPLDVTLTATVIAGTQNRTCEPTVCGTESKEEIQACGSCTFGNTIECITEDTGCPGTQTCGAGGWEACTDTFPEDNCPGITIEQILPTMQGCTACTDSTTVNCTTEQGCPGLHLCSAGKWSVCEDILDKCPSVVPTIAVENITPFEDITVVQNQAFTYKTRVTCYGGTCGNVEATLDPTTLTNGLISYWKLDETSGNAIDSHGNNDGTVNEATQNTSGKINTAYNFDGYNDVVTIPDSPNLNITGPFTITAWAQTNRPLAENFRYLNIVAKDSIFRKGYGIEIYERAEDDGVRLEVWARNGGTLRVAALEILYAELWEADTWYFIAGTYDGKDLKIYLNNTHTAIGTGINPESTAGEPLRIGSGLSEESADKEWPGKIDEIAIWNRALTPDEIIELYNSGSGLAYPFGEQLEKLTFQDGVDGYTGTQDSGSSGFHEISDDPGGWPEMRVNTGTLRGGIVFEDIFGGGANQIPLDATIRSATLTLVLDHKETPEMPVNVARIIDPNNKGLPDFDQTYNKYYDKKSDGTDWDTAGGDFTETNKAIMTISEGLVPEDSAITYAWDVKEIVQDWSYGEPNQGFVLWHTGVGGGSAYFHTSEAAQENRPKLTIIYQEPKGDVPMNAGTPFYTTSPNPQNSANTACLQNMQDGDSCINTWSVMPTGSVEETYTFFVDYIPENGEAKRTTQLDITIDSAENCTDSDADGEFAYDAVNCSRGTDCDDLNPLVKSGATEVCDNFIDDNCDGKTDEGCSVCIEGANVLQNEFFTYKTKVTCSGNCGNITATLDPTIIPYPKIEAVSDGAYTIGTDIYLENPSAIGLDRVYFGSQRNAGFRFNDIQIPAEAGIISAKLVMKADSESGDFVNVVIKGEKSDNPATFTTYNNFINRQKTQSFVEWNNIQEFDQQLASIYTPDLWPIIQELVDSPDWDSGDSIVIFIEDNGSSVNEKRKVFDYEVGGETRAATLKIIYQADKKDKGGTIPMNSGNPFYTINNNPQNSTNNTCLQNMQNEDVCYNTWDVNATGKTNQPFTFFVEYTSDNPTITAQNTAEFDITIVSSQTCENTDADAFTAYNPQSCSTGKDCDDSNPLINPDATEICDNEIDEDCDWELNNGCTECAEIWDCPDWSTIECNTGSPPYNFTWDFGDGSQIEETGSTNLKPHTYMAGYHNPKVTVSDATRKTAEATKTLNVSSGGNFPPIADTGGPYYTSPGTPKQLDGTGSSDAEGSITYEWIITTTKGTPNCVPDDHEIMNPTVTCSEAGTAEIKLTVTDQGAKTDTAFTTIKSSLTQTDDMLNIIKIEIFPEKVDQSTTFIFTKIHVKNETSTQHDMTIELKIIEADETNPQTLLTYAPWGPSPQPGPDSFQTIAPVVSIHESIWSPVLTPGKNYWLEATITVDGAAENDTAFNTKRILFSYVKAPASQGLTLSETSLALLILIVLVVVMILSKKPAKKKALKKKLKKKKKRKKKEKVR